MEAKGRKGKSFGVAIALVLLALIPHWRTILLGELPLPEGYLALIAPDLKPQLRQTPWNALWWDGISQFWAWRTEAMRQMHYNRIPLWTNLAGCGFPFLANPQTQCLYPPTLFGSWAINWLGRIFPVPFSASHSSSLVPIRSARLMAWLVFFHTFLALAGAYLLIRSYGISRLSSIVGAAAYGLGSFQIAWALLPTLPATAAWLPMTIWLLRKLMAAAADADLKRSVGFGIGFSFSLAMMLLAGHGQVAIYSLLALLLFAVLEFIPTYRKVKFAALFAIALPFVLSFLLAAAQLLPAMELAPFTHRHSAPTWEGYKAFAQRGLTIADWATMALPFLFGNPVDGSYFGKESFADYCAYAGFGILVLAILAASQLGKILTLSALQKRLQACKPASLRVSTLAPLPTLKPALLHALLLFPLGIFLASGSIFNLPLYFLLPGFSQLGTPSRAVFLCQLALGLMAAWVLDDTLNSGHKAREKEGWVWAIVKILLAIGLIALAIVYVGWWLRGNLPNFSWNEWLSFLTEQNIGVVAGFLAVIVFAPNRSQIPISQSPIFRYGVVVLLIGELCWFAGQQIPAARPSMVQGALQIAEQSLSELLKSVPSLKSQAPIRLLPIGGDWSLVRYPQSLLPPNSFLLVIKTRVADVRNYDSLLLRHHKTVMALFSNGNPCPLENGNLILMPMGQVSLQNAKRLAQIVGADAVVKAFGERFQIAEIFSNLLNSLKLVKIPRAFVPLKVRYVRTSDEAINQLRNCPEDTALLVASPQKCSAKVGDYALVVLDEDAFVRVEVRGLEKNYIARPVWLVLSDNAYPGWRAFSRKGYSLWQDLPITIANGAFRSCYVPNVFSEVVWIYFPSSFAVGLFLSCVGISLAIAIGVAVLLNPCAKSLQQSHN